VEPAALREKVRAEHERALRRFTGSSHPPETPVGDVFLPKAERVVGAKRLTSTVGRRSIRS
jgi:hypothetical protein